MKLLFVDSDKEEGAISWIVGNVNDEESPEEFSEILDNEHMGQFLKNKIMKNTLYTKPANIG